MRKTILIGLILTIVLLVGCNQNDVGIDTYSPPHYDNGSLIEETNLTGNVSYSFKFMNYTTYTLCSSKCALTYRVYNKTELDELKDDSFIVATGLTEENCEKCSFSI